MSNLIHQVKLIPTEDGNRIQLWSKAGKRNRLAKEKSFLKTEAPEMRAWIQANLWDSYSEKTKQAE